MTEEQAVVTWLAKFALGVVVGWLVLAMLLALAFVSRLVWSVVD